MNRAIYHVPMSQCYRASKGKQTGNVHLHLGEPLRSKRLARNAGEAVCGLRGWYERPAEPHEQRCPKCVEMATRHKLEWPDQQQRSVRGRLDNLWPLISQPRLVAYRAWAIEAKQ
jgi:hypothetical protein